MTRLFPIMEKVFARAKGGAEGADLFDGETRAIGLDIYDQIPGDSVKLQVHPEEPSLLQIYYEEERLDTIDPTGFASAKQFSKAVESIATAKDSAETEWSGRGVQ